MSFKQVDSRDETIRALRNEVHMLREVLQLQADLTTRYMKATVTRRDAWLYDDNEAGWFQ